MGSYPKKLIFCFCFYSLSPFFLFLSHLLFYCDSSFPRGWLYMILKTYTVHPACSVQKSPIFTILLFSFADRKEVKLQL